MGERSDSEKLSFKRNGFLPVDSVVDRDVIETALERIWESIPEGRPDPASLVGEGVLKEPSESVQIPVKFPEEDQSVAGAEFSDHEPVADERLLVLVCESCHHQRRHRDET